MKLENEIAVINQDLTQITDIMLRYAKSNSASLVEIAKNLKTSRDALIVKKAQLDRKWLKLHFEVEDDCA